MEVRRADDGGLMLEDMINFSLKFVLKRLDALYFFVPVLVFGILSLFITNAMLPELSNPDQFSPEMDINVIISKMVEILLFTFIIFLIYVFILDYAYMCLYAAASKELRGEGWNALGDNE
jgi:hypothetical protein